MHILQKNTHTCNKKHFVFSWKDVKEFPRVFSKKFENSRGKRIQQKGINMYYTK